MTTALVVETSVTVNNNSPIQDYVHPDDQTQPTFELSYSYTLPAGNANRFMTSSSKENFYSSMETASPQYRDEHEDSSFVWQHFHGIY